MRATVDPRSIPFLSSGRNRWCSEFAGNQSSTNLHNDPEKPPHMTCVCGSAKVLVAIQSQKMVPNFKWIIMFMIAVYKNTNNSSSDPRSTSVWFQVYHLSVFSCVDLGEGGKRICNVRNSATAPDLLIAIRKALWTVLGR